MSKRKRSAEAEVAVDPASSGRASERPAADNVHATTDGDGWTVVGAPKKRRTNDSIQGDAILSVPGGANENAPAQPTKAQTENGDAPAAQKAAPLLNPFTVLVNGSGRHDTPANPFSAKPPNETQAQSTSADVISPPRASSEERKQAKVERRKERKVERNYPAIEHSNLARLKSHVKIADLQSLVLYLLADSNAPQWVAVKHRAHIKHVVVLMVPGLELGMFNGSVPLDSSQASSSAGNGESGAEPETSSAGETNQPKRLAISPDDYYPAALNRDHLPDALKPLCDMFSNVWPVKGAAEQRGKQFFRIFSPIHSMLTSQIPKTQEEKKFKKNNKGPVPQNSKHWNDKRTPITSYIADLSDQLENNIVPHPAWFETPEAKEAERQRRIADRQGPEDGWVDSNVDSLDAGPAQDFQQGSLTEGRTIIAVDCEMCKAENDEQVLTRISLTNWDGEVILDELVKPDLPIKDYLTQWSGITEDMLKDVKTTLSDIQQRLLKLLTPHTILVGHSIDSDLNAIKLTHPFLVDTGILYPHPRGPPYKQSLKWLSNKYLRKEIQKGAGGHNSVEDARAALGLVKEKCERGPGWGTGDTNAESIFKRLERTPRPKSSDTRAGAVIDWGHPSRGHGGAAQVAMGCESDQEVVENIKLALSGQAVGKSGTTERLDFIWGRLRELELVRGWWDDSKSEDVRSIRKATLERLGCFSSSSSSSAAKDRNGEDASDEASNEGEDITGASLGAAVSRTVSHISQIYDSLPPCTAFIVYSGTGDPREMRRLMKMRQTWQEEYKTKPWDKLSVQWTDTEIQALSEAVKNARDGISLVTVK